jgi:Putative DNA-binding domain
MQPFAGSQQRLRIVMTREEMQTFQSGKNSKLRSGSQKQPLARSTDGTIAMRFADRQREFCEAVINPEVTIPAGLFGPGLAPSRKRFSVYRNNVVVGLIEALRASFPATSRIVGEEFFCAMARHYVMQQPPTSPVLLQYGNGFPGFIAQFGPAENLPYLADIARIERACSEAYHAPDQKALGADALSGLPSRRIADLCLVLHPSLRIVRSQFPSVTIWRMNVGDGVPHQVDIELGGQNALVLRSSDIVEVHSISPGVAALVSSLTEGNTLMMATEAASREAAFELSSTLAALIRTGAFIGYHFSTRKSP